MNKDTMLSLEAVFEFARLTGIPIDDDAMAERIAEGASAALEAVQQAWDDLGNAALFEYEPSAFLPTLEKHAITPVIATTLVKPDANLDKDRVTFDPLADLCDLDLVGVAAEIRAGKLTSVQVTQTVIARAMLVQAKNNCFINLENDRALVAAEHADAQFARGEILGALHGVPLAHKDMFNRAGHSASFGSQAHKKFFATDNATLIARLNAAGSINLGTLNMAEFALGATGHNLIFGDCLNIKNGNFIAGGSSSGSGVAVASGAVFGSFGSDTGGSVRIPAAANGVFGMKPTYGLIPRTGAMKLAPSIDVLGPIARSVRDIAALLQVGAGGDQVDSDSSCQKVPNYSAVLERGVAGLRIGVPTNYFFDSVHVQVRKALEASLKILEGAGACLVEIKLPNIEYLAKLSRVIIYSEAAALHMPYLWEFSSKYSPQVRVRASTGLAIPAPIYFAALQLRIPLLELFVAEVFSRVDVLHTPLLPIPVPTRIRTDVGDSAEMWKILADLVRCTAPFNYLGLPAMALPIGVDSLGLPISVQYVARPFAESVLLQVAAVQAAG